MPDFHNNVNWSSEHNAESPQFHWEDRSKSNFKFWGEKSRLTTVFSLKHLKKLCVFFFGATCLNIVKLFMLLCPPLFRCLGSLWWGQWVRRIEFGLSEDLEAFEQGERGSPAFALSSGRLHGYHLGCDGGRQLLVAGGREGGETDQRFVLTEVDGWCQAAKPTPLPHPPHCLKEDMLHREEVQTGRHFEEQTAKTRCQVLSFTVIHLPERKSGVTELHHSVCCVLFPLLFVLSAQLTGEWNPLHTTEQFIEPLSCDTIWCDQTIVYFFMLCADCNIPNAYKAFWGRLL